MTSRRQRIVSAHAEHASLDRRLATFDLPEGGRVHAYAHREGHHHLVTDGRAGHELSLRVPIGLEEGRNAGLALLRRLVAELAGRPLAPLHTVVLSPPVLGGATLGGVVLVPDPELGPAVLQAVGITMAEARGAALSSSEPLVSALSANDPRLVTLPHRDELPLLAPDGAPRSEGHEVPTLEVSNAGAHVRLEPARLRPTLVAHLHARLAHGLGLRLRGPAWVVDFEHAEADALELHEGHPSLDVAKATGPSPESEADSDVYGAYRAEGPPRDSERDGRHKPRKVRGEGGAGGGAESRLRVRLGPATRAGLLLDRGGGPLRLGPTTLHFVEDPAPTFLSPLEPEVDETEPLRPFEARRMAEEAASEQRLEEALSFIPLAVQDGSHGLLAELLHIDILPAASGARKRHAPGSGARRTRGSRASGRRYGTPSGPASSSSPRS